MTAPFADRYTREPLMTSADPRATPEIRVSAPAARTDVAPPTGRHAAPIPAPREPERAESPSGTVRAVGVALAVFAAGWAATFALLPVEGAGTPLGAASAVTFQGSLLALLVLMWRTRATGLRSAGRVLLGIQMGVLGVATVQSACEALPGGLAATLAVALDPFWPLSMLGMLIVGITVACVGRWRGAARVWAAVATSWILLLPTMIVLPESAIGVVAASHVLIGYVVLGVILAVRPELTRR